jgi:hypothetical protein
MDTFEVIMRKMKEMTEIELKGMIERNKMECICPDCPSYNDCAKFNSELLYCEDGKSINCIFDEKGCICGDCLVYKRMGMVNEFFCTRGSERALRGL